MALIFCFTLHIKVLLIMTNTSNSLEDIRAIRKIMEESSRFLSLSGLSGVIAGLAAIAGALGAWVFILDGGGLHLDEHYNSLSAQDTVAVRWQLAGVAVAVLVISVLNAFVLSSRKAKKAGRTFWTPASRQMLVSLFVPLATGGIFALALLVQNQIQLVIPCFLVFYGLALVSAGKFTFGEIFYLGMLQIATGLVSVFVPGWDLAFWVFGFGILHIIYGLAMYRKYEA